MEAIISQRTWQLCPACSFFSLAISNFVSMCFRQGRWGYLVALKFGVLGEGALGALLEEPADRLGVLWSLGESCSSVSVKCQEAKLV